MHSLFIAGHLVPFVSGGVMEGACLFSCLTGEIHAVLPFAQAFLRSLAVDASFLVLISVYWIAVGPCDVWMRGACC